MKVFVTGASGFIGKSICNRLIERGDEVVALTRDSSRLAGGWAKKVRVVQGDPSVQGNWQEAVDGTDRCAHVVRDRVAEIRQFLVCRLQRGRALGHTPLELRLDQLGSSHVH